MANISSIPPLLCSTPPPINFEEDNDSPAALPLDDEDEFGDYAVSPESNGDIPTDNSLASPCNHILTGTPPPLEVSDDVSLQGKSPPNVVETYNLDVTSKFKTLNITPPPITDKEQNCDGFSAETSDKSNERLHDEAGNCDNQPSLTFDDKNTVEESLPHSDDNNSRCNDVELSVSTMQLENCCPSKEVLENNIITHCVKLEDVIDDSSDDEFAVQRTNNDPFIDGDSEDFFSIHIVEKIDSTVEWQQPEGLVQCEVITQNVDLGNDVSFDHNKVTTSIPKLIQNQEESINDDDDYFQDFTSAQIVSTVQQQSIITQTPNAATTNDTALADDFESDDDDDFGDFTEATIEPVSKASLSNPVTVNSNNLTQRLIPILELMFPVDAPKMENIDKAASDIANAIKLDSIDTAKALEYQWMNSKVRNTLIKSLGIDSRNILYGEKWNPSMPRFAANLSFDPLKPLKPQTSPSSQSTDIVDPISSTAQTTQESQQINPVEFNWSNTGGTSTGANSSSGLSSSFDGVKEAIHTSQNGKTGRSVGDMQPPPQQQQQQEKSTIDNIGSIDTTIVIPSSVNSDCPATAATFVIAATTGTLPPILSADSIGSGINNNFNQIELTVSTDIDTDIEALDVFTTTDNRMDVLNASMMDRTATPVSNANATMNVEGHCVDDGDDVSEVVTRSTFAGPLKETHIYTPSRGETSTAKSTKIVEIDFDYEKAAAGIIIDEAVVKKEYRDVVYNPGFDLEFVKASNDSGSIDAPETTSFSVADLTLDKFAPDEMKVEKEKEQQLSETDDEFTDFQSVAPPPQPPTATSAIQSDIGRVSTIPLPTSNFTSPVHTKSKSTEVVRSRTNTPTINEEMILSPAILLPQAISMKNKKPQIEWGESAASINPEELARIEELFSQPKMIKTTEQNNSHRSTPIMDDRSQLNKSMTISENVAQREQCSTVNDDDWSDFVSVPLSNNNSGNSSNANIIMQSRENNNQLKGVYLSHLSPYASPQHQQQRSVTASLNSNHIQCNNINNANEEEWSDFVSSKPIAPPQIAPQIHPMMMTTSSPQFNSAAWQNANFYNNPLSCYQQGFINVPKLSPVKVRNHNNNVQPRQQYNRHGGNPQPCQVPPTPPQQIRIMHDFSTAAAPSALHSYHTNQTFNSVGNQFQVGNAKVSPSVSLIPDLGFVAPYTPARSTFVNSIPKPAFSTKK